MDGAMLAQLLGGTAARILITCASCQKTIPHPDLDKHVRRDHLTYRPFACGLCADAGSATSFYTRDDVGLHSRRFHNAALALVVEDLDGFKEAAFEKIVRESLRHRSVALPPDPAPASQTPPSTTSHDTPLGKPGPPAPPLARRSLDESGYLSAQGTPGAASPAAAERSRHRGTGKPTSCSLCDEDRSFRSYGARHEHTKAHLAQQKPSQRPSEEAIQELMLQCFPNARHTPPLGKRSSLVCSGDNCTRFSSFDHRHDHILRYHWAEADALSCNMCEFTARWFPKVMRDHCETHGPDNKDNFTDRRGELREKMQELTAQLLRPSSEEEEELDASTFPADDVDVAAADAASPPPSKTKAWDCTVCKTAVPSNHLRQHIWEHLDKLGNTRFLCPPCALPTPSEAVRAFHRQSVHGGVDTFVDHGPQLLADFASHVAQCFPGLNLQPTF